MWRAALFVAAALVACGGLAIAYGVLHWQGNTRGLQTRLNQARLPHDPRTYDERELDALPVPVQRYFRAVLTPGQRMIAAARVTHAGTFNMSGEAPKWAPFTSSQLVVTRRPGFVWDARIAMLPGLRVRVHDAYVAGDGILHATLFGIVSLANLRGTREVAEGELMRFLAEAPWYPTALLPSQGVAWRAVDDTHADATFRDGDVTVTMRFGFDREGLVETVYAAARGRTVDGGVVPTPWQGRSSAYETRAGMRVPLDGEVAWLMPDGPKPYWRGRITSLEYEFDR
jgi:hypothetical protein